MPLQGNIVQQMLAAAAGAAGAHWGAVSGDVKQFAENLAAQAAKTAADKEAGTINDADVDTEISMLDDSADMLKNYIDQALKLAAQNAINAAINVLVTAIKVL